MAGKLDIAVLLQHLRTTMPLDLLVAIDADASSYKNICDRLADNVRFCSILLSTHAQPTANLSFTDGLARLPRQSADVLWFADIDAFADIEHGMPALMAKVRPHAAILIGNTAGAPRGSAQALYVASFIGRNPAVMDIAGTGTGMILLTGAKPEAKQALAAISVCRTMDDMTSAMSVIPKPLQILQQTPSDATMSDTNQNSSDLERLLRIQLETNLKAHDELLECLGQKGHEVKVLRARLHSEHALRMETQEQLKTVGSVLTAVLGREGAVRAMQSPKAANTMQSLFSLDWIRRWLERMSERVFDTGKEAAEIPPLWRPASTAPELIRPYFPRSWYLTQHADVAAAGVDPLHHYVTEGYLQGRAPHPLFDPEWYRQQPSVNIAKDADPFQHFIMHGDQAGISPHPMFNPRWYRIASQCGDMGPFTHFFTSGIKARANPSPLFDNHFYLAQLPDAERAGIELPVLHYMTTGWRAGLRPHPDFDPADFVAAYPDTADYDLSPLSYYLRQNGPGHFHQDAPQIEDVKALREAFYTEESPLVSIVILNFNKSHMTAKCLAHLWRYTAGHPYEIIVVDNGSRAEEFRELTNITGPFKLVRLPVNRFFSEGNNIGVEASRGKYVMFLNNDAFVQQGWLPPLVASLESAPDIGGVGPRLIYPDGRPQEAGSIIDEKGDVVQLGKFVHLDPVSTQARREVDYCSAAAFLMRRETFDRILGFDLMYEPAYYEDVDLAFKIHALGLKILCEGTVAVIHVENATSATESKSMGLSTIVEVNKLRFLNRWQRYLTSRAKGTPSFPTDLIPPDETAPQSDPHRKTIAFYSPYSLVPGGGERYLLSAAIGLTRDYNVMLVTSAPYSRLRLRTLARDLSLDVSRLQMVSEQEFRLAPRPDLLVTLANELLPSIPLIGHKNIMICQFPFPMGATTVAERWDYQGHDRCIVYSQFVVQNMNRAARNLRLRLPKMEVITPPVDLIGAGATLPDADAPIIIGVGRFFAGGHNKRQDVMIKAFQQLSKTCPKAELHLVGSIHPEPEHRARYQQLLDMAKGYKVVFHPNASPDQLNALYQRARVYWHGAGYEINENKEPEKCEHFGISILEAMSAGAVPFVCPRGGPIEFVKDGQNGFIYHSIEDLAEKTQMLLDDKSLWAKLREASLRDAEGFSVAVFEQHWRDVCGEVLEGKTSHI